MFFKPVPEISIEDLKSIMQKKKNIELIDVREPSEFINGHIIGAKNRPLSQLSGFNSQKTVYVVCQSGNRSRKATKLLIKKGINAINVSGGMFSWDGPIKRGK